MAFLFYFFPSGTAVVTTPSIFTTSRFGIVVKVARCVREPPGSPLCVRTTISWPSASPSFSALMEQLALGLLVAARTHTGLGGAARTHAATLAMIPNRPNSCIHEEVLLRGAAAYQKPGLPPSELSGDGVVLMIGGHNCVQLMSCIRAYNIVVVTARRGQSCTA